MFRKVKGMGQITTEFDCQSHYKTYPHTSFTHFFSEFYTGVPLVCANLVIKRKFIDEKKNSGHCERN